MDPIDYAQARDAELNEQARTKREAARAMELSRPGLEDCERCDQPIGAARLAALPHARKCIECAIAAERHQVTRSRRL